MLRTLLAPIAVTAGLLVSPTVFGADFRALDFNAACDDLPAQEAGLGSRPFDEQLPSGFQYVFRARDLDRDVVVAYACREGHFFEARTFSRPGTKPMRPRSTRL